MALTRTQVTGTYYTVNESGSGTSAAPTLGTEGLSLKDLDGVTVIVSADATRTLSGAGNLRCYIFDPVFAVQATGTVTFSGLPVADETVTVGGVAFTAKAAATAGAAEFTIGASASATGDNFANAFTNYALNNAALRGLMATNSSGTVTITAIAGQQYAGYAGNAVTLTESATNTAVSGATLSGGEDGRWIRCPGADLAVTASGVRDMAFPDMEVITPRAQRIEWAADTVTISAGGITVHHLGWNDKLVY